MKNVFLDLGTHFGQGLREFIAKFNIDNSWSVHTFEPNPVTYNIFKNNFLKLTPYVKHYQIAVTDYDGLININIETPPNEGETGQGSSVIGLDKWNPWGGSLRENFKYCTQVPCIDLSKFILNNFDKNDYIIIKMDIEGSEYTVLDKMLKDGTIEYIDHISIEWHSRFFTNKDLMIQRESNLIRDLQKYDISLSNWH